MRPRAFSPTLAVLLFTAPLLSWGCGPAGEESPPAPVDGEAPADPAAAGLPEGHPPLPPPGAAVEPPPAGSGAGASGLAWTAPEGWVEEPPSSRLRRAQYRVPGEAGEAECVVFYFGPGQGGDATSNALRWAEQFTQPDGRPSAEAMETEELELDGLQVLMVRVGGTYAGGMAMMGGPAENLERHRLLGAIAEGPDANWFFKLTGPAATVDAQTGAFETMIRSLRQGE